MMNVSVERMNVVTRHNFDRIYPKELRRQFWEKVKRSMTEVFQTAPRKAAERVDRYRELVDGASPSEQILVYHQEPVTVAADLAEVQTVTEEHKARYLQIYGGPEPSSRGVPDAS